MKWSNFSSKQKIWIVCAVLAVGGIGVLTEDKKAVQKAEISVPTPPTTELLEKWSYGDSHNVAVLVSDTSALNANTAKEIVASECPDGCSSAYFYATKQAYDLHAYKRTKFGPSGGYGNNMKKLVAAEKQWKSTNNNWKTVKDNLVGTVSFGEYQAYPYRNEID